MYNKLHCKSQIALYNSLLKHGVDKHKFEIICECEVSELNEKERYYQDLYCVLGKGGLNCILTQASGRSGELSKETKAKIGKAHLGNKHCLGKKMNQNTRQKLREANIGRRMSEENKEKMRGKKRPQHVIEKMRKSNIGKKLSEETKAKISKSLFRNNRAIKNKVLNTETGIVYNSIQEVSKIESLKYTTLRAMLTGQNPNKTKCVLIN